MYNPKWINQLIESVAPKQTLSYGIMENQESLKPRGKIVIAQEQIKWIKNKIT